MPAPIAPPQAGGRDIELRRDFRPLVFWLGSVSTDSAGRATTTVTLPDSLTTYRIMAVAGDLQVALRGRLMQRFAQPSR
jgi:uncharacterized protein YfaS (alpha-2-macroglobulin family)